jgi:hypothetical protein
MLKQHSLAELTLIAKISGVGGGLGIGLMFWSVTQGGHPNGADLLGYIAFGSGLAMILTSAYITWRKSA